MARDVLVVLIEHQLSVNTNISGHSHLVAWNKLKVAFRLAASLSDGRAVFCADTPAWLAFCTYGHMPGRFYYLVNPE